jgi:putative transposase
MSFPRQIVPGRTYLVTRRCTQRQFLLRPDRATTEAFIYCLAYAAKKTGIDVVAFIANSNHYHAVVVDRHGLVPQFLEDFHRLLAKHQNVLRGRRENFWASEQTSLVELVGEDDVLAKIVYTLTNPAKDHLVKRSAEWPGATSLRETLTGATVVARRPAHYFRADGGMPDRMELNCALPPSHAHVNRESFADDLREQIARIEADAADERRRTGRRVMGVEAILAQRPTDCPSSVEPRRTIDPRIAARDKLPRIEAIQRLKEFRASYAIQRNAWLKDKDVVFPLGTWWLRRFAEAKCVEESAPG